MAQPAYTRLHVDERRRQLLDAGAQLFASHSFEEISMREIAATAGVSKPLLYHYFPSKTELFKAAVAEKAEELQRVIAPSHEGSPIEQLTQSLDAYLAWVEENARTWSKLMRSAATLPEARELVESFRERTMDLVLAELTGGRKPRPALRTAINGWLGFMDAAILDWAQARDLPRTKLRDLLIAAFGGALMSAQNADPRVRIQAG
jgi:AcrR family transcriptional regulator